VPHRRQARPFRGPQSAARFLPPQPIADRERAGGIIGRLGRRSLAIGVVAAAIAVLVPLAFAALGPSAGSLPPLGGDVRGAVTSPKPAAADAGVATIDPRLLARHPSDADGPHRPPGPLGAVAPETLTGYVWPIQKGRISLPFKDIPGGTRIRDGKLMHDGLDMASFCGAPVGSAHDGVVLAAGRQFDEQIGWIGDLQPYFHLLDVRHMWGDLPNVVVIDDGNGYRSIYAHFRDVTVQPGQHVKAGQLIGHEGATGHASGCHVHYGLFSPFETRTFGVRADILRNLRVPKAEIARVDPALVLPGGEVAIRTRSIAKAIAAAKLAAAPG
jgi:murein DD-endopeptidase MepM/ murein hydrolase activator NlpD